MSDDSKIVGITIEAPFVAPSDRPVKGDRRIVRMLPTGLPGAGVMLCPCIWMSPYEVYHEDQQAKMRICLLLISKGPPRPEIHAVWIPSSAIEKFPEDVVEW